MIKCDAYEFVVRLMQLEVELFYNGILHRPSSPISRHPSGRINAVLTLHLWHTYDS